MDNKFRKCMIKQMHTMRKQQELEVENTKQHSGLIYPSHI